MTADPDKLDEKVHDQLIDAGARLKMLVHAALQNRVAVVAMENEKGDQLAVVFVKPTAEEVAADQVLPLSNIGVPVAVMLSKDERDYLLNHAKQLTGATN